MLGKFGNDNRLGEAIGVERYVAVWGTVRRGEGIVPGG